MKKKKNAFYEYFLETFLLLLYSSFSICLLFNQVVIMNIQLLEKIKEYIEKCEESFSAEYDCCQSKEELIELKKMPDIYYNVINEIDSYQKIEKFIQKQKPLEKDFYDVLNKNFWGLLS